ncbi:MAG: recombinase family protein [Candidatus ainarchaeum sp.]|nr:recombinase family protein [Candidatus ainarchaeum sp.]
MKCVIYLRVSTEEQEPENQKKECLEFARNRGYEVIDVFLERLSGFKDINRPNYEKVKEMARKGEIQAVVVWAIDRWVRNRDTLLEDVVILRNYGTKLHSVKEAWLEAINIDGSLGKTIQEFLLGLIGSIAEMESQRKSERVKIAFKNHKGKKWGRPKTHTNKIKVILDWYNQGLSYRQISEKTNLSIGKISQIINVHKNERENTLNKLEVNEPIENTPFMNKEVEK